MTLKPLECGASRHENISREYSRILTAAVISSKFRQLLLSNPAKAIAAGFGGEAFSLEIEDKNRVAAIHVSTLADFATELNRIQTQRTVVFKTLAGD
jgi:hypothetical protein